MKRRPTIDDVATKARLSISTVSLVINNKPNVSDATRLKVRNAIKALSYHPHHSARGLASKLTGNIGFILSDNHFSQAEPFYTKIFLGTEFEARDHNYYVLLTTVGDDVRRVKNLPRFLLERNVDGVIVAGKIGIHLVEQIERLGVPIVLVDYALPRSKQSTICIDNGSGASIAVKHLFERGHTSVGFIGGDIDHPSIAERFNAYKEALADIGIPYDARIVVTNEQDTGQANGFNAAMQMNKSGGLPRAIFAANDAMAIGCMQYIKSLGKNIPGDVALAGFDDIEMSTHVEPRLTTVRVPKELMGKLAVQRVVEMIRSKTNAFVHVRVPVELMVRESSAGILRSDVDRVRIAGHARATY